MEWKRRRHREETTAPTLSFDGREVGRFPVLPDRIDAWGDNARYIFLLLLRVWRFYRMGGMGGTLREDWICDEKALGFEERHILRFKFAFAPELSTRPILNDTYKRPPTLVTQKLRKPQSDLVCDATFGRCLHFLETNLPNNMIQRDDDVDVLIKRTVDIQFDNKRNLRDTHQRYAGVYLRNAHYILPYGHVVTPSVRRAFFRYGVNFITDYPVDICEDTLRDIREIENEFAPTLRKDTEKSSDEMIGRMGHPMQEGYELAESSVNAPPPLCDTGGNVEMEERLGLLTRAHRATASNIRVRTYKLRALTDNVIPGLRKDQPANQKKKTKMDNFAAELGRVSGDNVIQLLGRTSTPTEFH